MPSEQPDRHGPNRLSRHQRIHETVMGQFLDEGFVLSDGVRYQISPDGSIGIKGIIGCQGGIVIQVIKELVTVEDGPDPLVQTDRYKYHASVLNHGSFLRFDNSHAHRGHVDEHHRHDMDWRVPEDDGQVTWLGVDRWPVLGDVIAEARDWYYQHLDELQECDESQFAALQAR